MDVRELEDQAACLPLERLEAEITTLAGHLAAAECRWLLLVAEFDRRDGWGQWGCLSASHWLGWKCGIELRAAQEKVRVARALHDLPAITDAFARGELSYSQVRALTRVAEPATEADLLVMARHATAAQLERLVRGYRRVMRDEDETAAANARHDRRHFSYSWDDDGSFVYFGRSDPEEGALLLAAIEAECERSAERPHEDPVTRTADRPLAARRADAVCAIARASLDAESERSAERSIGADIGVHVDAEVMISGGPGRCELEHGPALAPETVRRLACDGVLVTLLDGLDGTPLDVGRRTRKVTNRLRRAVLTRDHQCVFPGCHRTRVEIHHRMHWSSGGLTDLDNLDALCSFHHRLVHEGGWTMNRDGSGLVAFRRPDGTALDPDPARPGPHDHDLERDNERAGVTITPTTLQPKWFGDPLELDWAVADLCRRREQGRFSAN